MKVFRSLPEAILAGFHAYDKTPYGWLVRIKLSSGRYALAIVDMR
jgi:hypothetical protein